MGRDRYAWTDHCCHASTWHFRHSFLSNVFYFSTVWVLDFNGKKAFVVSVLGNSSSGLGFTWKTVYKGNN
jgi:hypothetical protein